MGGGGAAPPVTEKTFDEYHLYTLERSTTLLDREKKQVEFVQAAGIKSTALYIYDGAATDPDQSWVWQSAHYEPEYGTQSSKKVWVMREFINSAANHLGLPLPKGRVRFYRRNTDGQMEFTGENIIKHTPRDEVIRLYTGNAFDLVGERKQTNFKVNIPPSTVQSALMVIHFPALRGQEQTANLGLTSPMKSSCATISRTRWKFALWNICVAGATGR